MAKRFIILKIDNVSVPVGGMGTATLGMSTVEVPQNAPFLEAAYQLLGCEMVDVLPVLINGKKVDVWFDQDFLAKGTMPMQTSLVFTNIGGNEVPIFGKVLLAGTDDEGGTLSVGVSSDETRHAIAAHQGWAYGKSC